MRRPGAGRPTRLESVGAFLCWWLGLFGLWTLLVGSWDLVDGASGALIAALAAALAETARRAGRASVTVPLEVLRASASVPGTVFVDFALLTTALLRCVLTRRVVRGRYLARTFDPGPTTTPRGAARRAWTVLLAGYSPNAYVVDIDVEQHLVLVHDLIPRRRSESPA